MEMEDREFSIEEQDRLEEQAEYYQKQLDRCTEPQKDWEKILDEWKKDVEEHKIEGYEVRSVAEPDPFHEYEIRPLVDKLIEHPSLNLITGAPNSGKTWFALDLAVSICDGKEFLGRFKTMKENVLYLNYDIGRVPLKRRVGMLCDSLPTNLYFTDLNSDKLDSIKYSSIDLKKTEMQLERLHYIMGRIHASVLIVDTWADSFTGNENSSQDVSDVLGLVTKIFVRNGITVIYLTHTIKVKRGSLGKEFDEYSGSRGSSVIDGKMDNIFRLIERDKEQNPIIIEVLVKKQRNKEKEPDFLIERGMNNINNKMEFRYLSTLSQQKVYVEDECISAINEWIKKNGITEFRFKEIQEVLPSNFKENAVHRALKVLLQRGNILSKGSGRAAKYSVVSPNAGMGQETL